MVREYLRRSKIRTKIRYLKWKILGIRTQEVTGGPDETRKRKEASVAGTSDDVTVVTEGTEKGKEEGVSDSATAGTASLEEKEEAEKSVLFLQRKEEIEIEVASQR